MVCEITPEIIQQYKDEIQRQNIQKATKDKYLHDLQTLQEYLQGEELTQEKLDAYPEWLVEKKKYKKNSVNTTIVSAKKFILTMGWNNLKPKSYFMDNQERKKLKKFVSRENYETVVRGAVEHDKPWLAMMLQTLCHMDIRYSEFPLLTVEQVEEGYIDVVRLGREIRVEIPGELCELLLTYAESQDIREGIIFRTANGTSIDRSYAWRELKNLCRVVGVEENECTLLYFKMPVVEDYYPYVDKLMLL